MYRAGSLSTSRLASPAHSYKTGRPSVDSLFSAGRLLSDSSSPQALSLGTFPLLSALLRVPVMAGGLGRLIQTARAVWRGPVCTVKRLASRRAGTASALLPSTARDLPPHHATAPLPSAAALARGCSAAPPPHGGIVAPASSAAPPLGGGLSPRRRGGLVLASTTARLLS